MAKRVGFGQAVNAPSFSGRHGSQKVPYSLPRVLEIPIPSGVNGSSSEVETSYNLNAGEVVLDAWIKVTTAPSAGTTKTLDVGLKDVDADGFLDGVSVATVGTKKGTLVSSGQTQGALLRVDESGSGGLVPEKHVVAATKKVTCTAGSNDVAGLAGTIYLLIAG